jgi:hypothetical protein
MIVVVLLTDSGSLFVRRRVICDLIPEVVVVEMGSFEFAMTCNFELADRFFIF